MSNKSEKTYTSRNISNSKWLLAVGTAVEIAIDALIMVLLCIGAYSFKFIAFPCVMLVLDAVYLAVGIFATNYRFKYSIAVWLVYILLTAVFCICGMVILVTLDGTVLTTVALVLWIVVHAVSIVCAIFTALYTSKKFKSSVFTIIITLILAALCALYAVFLFSKGFFGQGLGVRTLVYDYNESDDSYTVSDVLSGSSKKVEIENTFNGKPVKAINCSIFTDNTVKEYVLHDDFELVDSFELANGVAEGKSILVNAEDAAAFRGKLFSYANDVQGRANVLKLANATVPFNLEENKGYIAFDYDEDAYAACGGNVLPIIIGDKGTAVDLSAYASTFEYISHSNKSDVADLKWGYENCSGYILDNIVADGSSLLSGYVLGEGANACVEFEKVYRIYVGSGNDTKYDLRTKQSAFCCDNLNGTTLDYRYIAKSNANTFFNSFTQRNGFSLVWTYGVEGSGNRREFSSLTEAIENLNSSALSISPEWTLDTPRVVLQSNYTITYGEDVTFSTTAISPASGISLIYEWRHDSANVGSSKDLSLTTPSLSDGENGQYVLTVTTDGGDVTSLVSSVQKTVNLTINKKVISFGWNMPAEDDRVYSGTAKTVTVTFDNSQLVQGDELVYKLSTFETTSYDCINVGDYFFSVNIDSTSAKNYQVDSTGTASLKITPFIVDVVWSDYDFTYNGLPRAPIASGLGVNNQPLALRVDGCAIDAGTNYTVTANCVDSNYELTNSTFKFDIKKAPLTATAKTCSTVYGLKPIGQGADFIGFVNDETDFDLSGELIYSFINDSDNAGTYTDCVVISGLISYNYDITFLPGDLEIIKRTVIISWQNATDLVYDGQAQNVSAIISNKVKGDDVIAVVTGGDKVNAGSYTAEVVSLSGSTADNYVMNDVFTKEYTIAKAAVTITPNSVTAVYGDSEKGLTANVSGEIYNGDFTYTLERASGNTVGSYAITVNLSGDYTTNYEVKCNQGTYTINPRTVTLAWSGYENLVYDGTAKNVTATLNNVVDGDDIKVTISNGGNSNAGKYTATATLTGTSKNNYALSANTLDYTIAKAKITLTAQNATSVYGQPIAALTVSLTGTIYNSEVVYSAKTTATSSSPVGTYDITVVVGTYSNYDITTVKATYTVTQATPTLNGFTDGSFSLSEEVEYGATLGDITAKLPAQTLSGSWVWADGESKVADVGTNTYTVTFNPTDSNNYQSVMVNVTITVKSAEDPVNVG